jgi:RimJ/RimL family protein N-acetyltransferase
MTPADIDDALVAQLRDPLVSGNLAVARNPAMITRPGLLHSLDRYDHRRKFWLGLWRDGEMQRLGCCLASVDTWRVATITIAITDRGQWSKGAGTAGTLLLRSFLFDAVGVHKVAARIYANNTGTIRLTERLGSTREALLREVEVDATGARRDVVLFGILREEHARFMADYTPAGQ